MGRPFKSIAEHQLHGTYRRDRHGDRADGASAPGSPIKPADLPADAAELWESILGSLPTAAVASVDYAALTGCCRWYSVMLANLRQLDAGTGDAYKLTTLASIASKQFATFAQRFGLTPADRAKLRLLATEIPDADEMRFFSVPTRDRSA